MGNSKYVQLLLVLILIGGVLISAVPQPLVKADQPRASKELVRPVPRGANKVDRVLPVSFEASERHSDGQANFMSRLGGMTMFVSPTKAVLELQAPVGTGKNLTDRAPAIVTLSTVDSNPQARSSVQDELLGTVNYFVGKDSSKWRTKVPTYEQVRYDEVYPGIDLVYHGTQGKLEYDFIVGPGVDPGRIALDVTGARVVRLDQDGGLILETEHGEIRQERPIAYQEERGIRKDIATNYVLRDGHRISFQVADYDSQQPLVIDPTLVYSTYLGGVDGRGVAVDSIGNAYVTGFGYGPGPTTCAFVTKLDPSGTSFYYTTYLCGTGQSNQGSAIAVDAVGNAYVTGLTDSTDFPTVNPLQPALGREGFTDAFVSKLDSSGSLIYSTYLGGSDYENNSSLSGIAVDGLGNAYVTGMTMSQNFPTVNAFQPENADHDCVDPEDPCELSGTEDGFVAKLNPAGSALVFSTYLGGMNNDEGFGIAVDPDGNSYVTGFTQAYFIESTLSFDFPIRNAFQPTPLSEHSAFVSKFSPTGSLVYSTYLGGHTNATIAYSIAVDALGSAYVTGNTGSQDFPTKNSIQGCTGVNDGDVFVSKFTPSGRRLVYSTCLGGLSEDFGNGIAVNSAGRAHVTGSFGGSGYVWQLNSRGSALLDSGTLGGSELGNAIAVDNDGNAYIVNSSVTKLRMASTDCTYSISPTSQTFNALSNSDSVRVRAPAQCSWTAASNENWITVTAGDGIGNGTVRYSVSATSSPRTGTIIIADKIFTVAQMPTYYYGLGDSVASGHGLPDETGGPCRQSANAYPRIVGRTLARDGVIDRGSILLNNGDVRFLGCSGTTTGVRFPDYLNKFLSVQVDAAISDLRAIRAQGSANGLVSITVGANDFPWADVLPGGDGPRFMCQPRPAFEAETQNTAALVHDLLRAEVVKLIAEGDVSVVLTTYHNPFNQRSVFFSPPLGNLIGYRKDVGCLLIPNDAELYDRTNYVVDELNRVITLVVAETGNHATLADVHRRFSHHESPKGPAGFLSCGYASPQFGNSWIQAPLIALPITPPYDVPRLVDAYRRNDCFHPNEGGAVRYAQTVAESAGRRLLP